MISIIATIGSMKNECITLEGEEGNKGEREGERERVREGGKRKLFITHYSLLATPNSLTFNL